VVRDMVMAAVLGGLRRCEPARCVAISSVIGHPIGISHR